MKKVNDILSGSPIISDGSFAQRKRKPIQGCEQGLSSTNFQLAPTPKLNLKLKN